MSSGAAQNDVIELEDPDELLYRQVIVGERYLQDDGRLSKAVFEPYNEEPYEVAKACEMLRMAVLSEVAAASASS